MFKVFELILYCGVMLVLGHPFSMFVLFFSSPYFFRIYQASCRALRMTASIDDIYL